MSPIKAFYVYYLSIGLKCSKSLHQDPEEIRNDTDPSAVATPYSERFGFQMNFEALQRHDSYSFRILICMQYHISMLKRLNVTSCGKFRCQREKFQVRILNRLQACVTIWIIFTLKINSIKFVVFISRLYKMYINKFGCLHLTRFGVNDHKASSSSVMRRLHPFSQYYKSIELRHLHYTTTSRGTSQS